MLSLPRRENRASRDAGSIQLIPSRWSHGPGRRRPVSSLASARSLPPRARLPEGEAEMAEQLASLIVIPGRRHDRDVHALGVLDLVGVDLGEDDLLGEPQTVVAVAVEAVGIDAPEVA